MKPSKSSSLLELFDYADVGLLQGDARKALRTLPSTSFQAVVTSPPYFAQRRYTDGNHAEIGLGNIKQYFGAMLDVTEQLYRVLRDDGTFWLNLGDKYVGGDLQLVPFRFALQLKKQGWLLRCCVHWCKTNPLPRSVKTRPTEAVEYFFMFTKSGDYFYRQLTAPSVTPVNEKGGSDWVGWSPETLVAKHAHRGEREWRSTGRRNLWNYWLASCAQKDGLGQAHTARMPSFLARRCIKLSTKKGDWVLDPFMGTGTTIREARGLKRRAVGIDLREDLVEWVKGSCV